MNNKKQTQNICLALPFLGRNGEQCELVKVKACLSKDLHSSWVKVEFKESEPLQWFLSDIQSSDKDQNGEYPVFSYFTKHHFSKTNNIIPKDCPSLFQAASSALTRQSVRWLAFQSDQLELQDTGFTRVRHPLITQACAEVVSLCRGYYDKREKLY